MKNCKKILIQIGMKENLKGFEYICDAISIINIPQYKYMKWSDVYNMIGEWHDTSGSNVEKAIRNALESARNNLEHYDDVDKYLGYDNCSNSNTLLYLNDKLQDYDSYYNKEEIKQYVQMKCKIMIEEIFRELNL